MKSLYYINSTPTNDNYGNPSSRGEIALPDEFLDIYIQAKGFVFPTIVDNTVVSLDINHNALNTYNREYPSEEEVISDERVLSMIIEEFTISPTDALNELLEVLGNA